MKAHKNAVPVSGYHSQRWMGSARDSYKLQPGVPVPGIEGNAKDDPTLRPYVPRYEELKPGDGLQNSYIRWIFYRIEGDWCVMGAEGCAGQVYHRDSIEGKLGFYPFVPRPEDWEERYSAGIESSRSFQIPEDKEEQKCKKKGKTA